MVATRTSFPPPVVGKLRKSVEPVPLTLAIPAFAVTSMLRVKSRKYQYHITALCQQTLGASLVEFTSEVT